MQFIKMFYFIYNGLLRTKEDLIEVSLCIYIYGEIYLAGNHDKRGGASEVDILSGQDNSCGKSNCESL